MNKLKINMIGGGFQHAICSCGGSIPKYVEWQKDGSANISIHIDRGIQIETNKNKINYGFLSESKTILPDNYSWCVNNIDYLKNNFINVFTHDKALLEISDIFKYTVCSSMPWVKNRQIHKKTKLLSMISSNKNFCKEHAYRLSIIEKYKNNIDLYGRGFKEIETKELGLNDYCFSIVIENATYDYMFTEKIADCFATGTIPIYYGCKEIINMFDKDGIIIFNDDFKIETLSFELYNSKIKHVKNNFELIKKHITPEDYIYLNYLKS